MKQSVIAASMMVMGLAAGMMSMPARADSHDTLNFEVVMKMADKNQDGTVTKAEFLEAMGKAYDMTAEAFEDVIRATLDQLLQQAAHEFASAEFAAHIAPTGGIGPRR
jgi:hypothetical protein